MIKYRAWHSELNMMFEVKSLVFTLNLATIASKNDLVPSRTCSFDDIILMQSTGLVDVNGKEIFEGDVVRMRSGELLPVKIHHGMFDPVCFYVSSVFELVGNVFENPELLEEPDFRGVYDDYFNKVAGVEEDL